MAEQKIFPQQIDTTGSTTGQVLFSNGTNAYWGSGGFTGSNGYTGSVGIGYTGSNGYFGSVGYSGSIGNPGYTGSQGFWGSNGYFGSVGYSGSKGDSGYSGSKGTDGVIGYGGSVGYTGSIGAGYTGSTGTTAILYTSTTAPASPVAGTFWYKTDEATLYVYYSDGDSSQWVGVTAAGSTGYTGSSGGGGGGNGYTGSIGYSGSSGSASLTSVRQQFTGDGSTTTFAIAGGYTANAISVFVNGVLLRNGTEVTVTNGSTVVFAIAPLSGALIDVIGTVPTTYSSITPISYSVSFSGATGQYLSLAGNAAFNFGTGDFTVECWAYFNDLSDYRTLMGNYTATTTGGGNWLMQHIGTTNKMGFYYDGGANVITGTTTLATGTWYHFAMVRLGAAITAYVNGLSQGTATFSGTVGSSSASLNIGAPQNISIARMNGYISSVRLTKGVGVYTGAFTPPQTPLAIVQSATNPSINAITGTQTSLLTCNGPTIIDGSTNAFTITNNGSAPVSTAIAPTFTNVSLTSYPPPTTIGNIPFSTDGATWSSTSKIVQGTAVATTSGTAIDFTNIPSWVKRITVMFNGVSLSGSASILVQIGAGSTTTSGYSSTSNGTNQASATGGISSTTGFCLRAQNAAGVTSGHMVLTSLGNNTWIESHTAKNATTEAQWGGGTVTLSGTLDRVRITTDSADTFDAGSVNILYE
jgi:hypothetical protein